MDLDCANWVVASCDQARARQLAQAVHIQPLTAQLLINRGFDDPARAERFLTPRLAYLRRPDGTEPMQGFERAVTRLADALLSRQVIGVFGDYDADGVTSCALLSSFLRAAGARVVSRVARRDAGYGFG